MILPCAHDLRCWPCRLLASASLMPTVIVRELYEAVTFVFSHKQQAAGKRRTSGVLGGPDDPSRRDASHPNEPSALKVESATDGVAVKQRCPGLGQPDEPAVPPLGLAAGERVTENVSRAR